ncbi:MAG TPA: POTRA domain-containing protein [Gemmatimonadales bacterium]|nr:POTRA domain-containing protein [Gemmatimonadales bacterium]
MSRHGARIALGVALLAPGAGLFVTAVAQQPAPADTGHAAPVIRGIEINRENLFDSVETRHWWARWGNSLHRVTRPWVIRREFLFKPGDTYDSALVAETERNLRHLGHFRDVQFDTVTTDSGLVVRLRTRDGWTTRLNLTFGATGNQFAYSISLFETNLLGTGTEALVGYRHNPDRDVFALGVGLPRIIAHKIGVTARYENKSDGEAGLLAVGQPWYSLASRNAFLVSGQFNNTRVLRYFDGDPDPLDTLTRNHALVLGELGHAISGGSKGYVRLGATGFVQQDGFRPGEPGPPVPQATSGALGAFSEVSRSRFVVYRGYESFDRNEDIDVSSTARLTLYAAPAAFGYEDDGVGTALFLSTGSSFLRRAGFATLSLTSAGRFASGGLDSGTAILQGVAALHAGARHLFVLASSGGMQDDVPPGDEFDLGFGYGPRAFRTHAFTGDRFFFATAEYRALLNPKMFGLLGVGAAAFADVGGAWYHTEASRTGSDAGIGLRLGLSPQAEPELLRIDLAYRFPGTPQGAGWVVSIGKGFQFGFRGPPQ